MKVTSGTVSYSRVRKDDDFGIKREASASFSYTLDDDEDASEHAATLFDIAVDRVHKAIRISDKPAPIQTTASVATEEKPPKAKPGPKPKSAPSSVTLTNPGAGVDTIKLAAKVSTFGVNELDEALSGGQAEANDLGDLLGDEGGVPQNPVKMITDAEMLTMTDKKNKALGKPQLVRELINAFTGGPPKVIRDIPADKRQEYLDKLDALK